MPGNREEDKERVEHHQDWREEKGEDVFQQRADEERKHAPKLPRAGQRGENAEQTR